MQPLTLGEIAQATGGSLRGRGNGVRVWNVDTDSRAVAPGSLFVALKGGKTDGHDHALEALARGASAALVGRGRLASSLPGTYVEVDDPLAAMGRLAGAYRRRLGAKVVAITGSNGKTTTKEMLSAICAAAGPTIRSPKSFNNAIGLPMTCFHIGEHTHYAVLEMGANAPGEIAALAEIAQPDIAVVTNIGRAHLGGFGGTLAGVARAKGELVEAVAKRGGTVVLNGDDPNSKSLFDRAKGGKVIRFGSSDECDFQCKNWVAGSMGLGFFRQLHVENDEIEIEVEVEVEGRHNAMNALASMAVAKALGIDLNKAATALYSYVPPPMRLEEQSVGAIRLVNDAYNANPDSMQAALDWLAVREGRKVACLGEMLELGKASETLHKELGAAAAKAGVALLVGVGPAGKWIVEGYRTAGGKEALVISEAQAAGEELARLLKPGDVVLFKASRGAALERAVEACAKALEK